jgi:fructose-bisphosphate aldolase class 1
LSAHLTPPPPPAPARQSTGTIGNRLSSIGVENVVENRQALREM